MQNLKLKKRKARFSLFLVSIFLISAIFGNVVFATGDNTGTEDENEAAVAEGENENETIVDEEETACYNAASSLGWIVCPVFNILTGAMEGLYTKFVLPALKIESDFVSTGGGTHKAWEMFRDVANIVFGIFFVFIILSQLTGIGIDNYGIKRSLPRIIITALLVNLSFIVCQLAVDVSNIVGASLGSYFETLAESIEIPAELTSNLGSGSSFLAGLGALGIIAVSGIALIIANGGVGPALLAMFLPLLTGVASAVLALLFMFFLLALRKSLVIILVVLSPLAFVCYSLPNTKSLFTKWLKAIEGMLLLYPICSIIIGGGLLASNIILSTGKGNNNFFIALTAMLAQVIPYFFIPTLIRGSFKAIGGVGSSIGNLGKRWGRGFGTMVRKGVEGSHFAQNVKEKGQLHKQRTLDISKVKSAAREKYGIEKRRLKADKKKSLAEIRENGMFATQEDIDEVNRSYKRQEQALKHNRYLQTHFKNGSDLSQEDTARLAHANTILATTRSENLKNAELARPGSYERIVTSQDEKRKKELDEETRADLRAQTNNYDLDRTNQLLNTLINSVQNGGKSASDPVVQSQMRVLMQTLSASGPGKGMLAKTFTESSSPAMRRFMAGEIQSDQSLLAAVKSKDAHAARFAMDINSGAIDANTNFNDWLRTERPGEGISNAQFVVKKDLSDDADLTKLSSDALERTVKNIPTSRLEFIYQSRNYASAFSDADRRAKIETELASRADRTVDMRLHVPHTPASLHAPSDDSSSPSSPAAPTGDSEA